MIIYECDDFFLCSRFWDELSGIILDKEGFCVVK